MSKRTMVFAMVLMNTAGLVYLLLATDYSVFAWGSFWLGWVALLALGSWYYYWETRNAP